ISNANTGIGNQQEIANKGLVQQQFNNEMGLAGAKANTENGIATGYQNQGNAAATQWANIGSAVGQGVAAISKGSGNNGSSTGDTGVLDEMVRFLEGRAVNAEEDSYYDLPGRSEETASLYDHCKRAIVHGLRYGEHGLPLMGSGDWNDGMNPVGIHGKGESVWLGFFLYAVLEEFALLAGARGDKVFTERCLQEAAQVSAAIERSAWDGGWYRRAYFDDGGPLGSAGDTECQIDSIAQSWAVLSGAGDAERSRKAMKALDERLVRRDRGLVQL